MTYLPLIGLLGFVPLLCWLWRKEAECRAEAFSIIEEAINNRLREAAAPQGGEQ